MSARSNRPCSQASVVPSQLFLKHVATVSRLRTSALPDRNQAVAKNAQVIRTRFRVSSTESDTSAVDADVRCGFLARHLLLRFPLFCCAIKFSVGGDRRTNAFDGEIALLALPVSPSLLTCSCHKAHCRFAALLSSGDVLASCCPTEQAGHCWSAGPGCISCRSYRESCRYSFPWQAGYVTPLSPSFLLPSALPEAVN